MHARHVGIEGDIHERIGSSLSESHAIAQSNGIPANAIDPKEKPVSVWFWRLGVPVGIVSTRNVRQGRRRDGSPRLAAGLPRFGILRRQRQDLFGHSQYLLPIFVLQLLV